MEVDVLLADGSFGRCSVPSGASTGDREAVELRDCDPSRFDGLGVLCAVDNIIKEITPAIIGREAGKQPDIDRTLVELDGTEDKSRLGANTLLGVSIAVVKAAASSRKVSLFKYLNTGEPFSLPVPMLNVLNGGKHAEGSTDFQEFMVVPVGFDTFRRSLRAGVEIYHALKRNLSETGLGTSIGDEGGFAPAISSNRNALDLIVHAIETAGYQPGEQCFIALDIAASELADVEGKYRLHREQKLVSTQELVDTYEKWIKEYPIISIEDGLSEHDWAGWSNFMDRLGSNIQLVGDDLFATNTKLIRLGIEQKVCNAVLVKLNQIGTVTETLEAISMAKTVGWGTIISHRSGETEDTTISDLAVGTSAGQIKAGAPARGERTSKYNRLLRIEESLGKDAIYAGMSAYERFGG